MGRGRKFRTSRRTPDSERSLFEQMITGRYSRTLDRTDLLNLVRGGEDSYLEFKIRLVNIDKITAEIVAIANSGGGAIVFGVNDQRRIEGLDDPESVEEELIDICRNHIKPPILPHIDKVSFDNGIRIVVLQVDDRRAPHTTPDNRYFIRIGSTKREADGAEIAGLFGKGRSASIEDMPLPGASVEDVDEALVWSYVRDLEGEVFREPEGFPTQDALKNLMLASEYGARVTPTLAGLLLFGRTASVRQRVPQGSLILTRYSGADLHSPVVERIEFYGNLASLFEQALGFIKRYVDIWDTKPPKSSMLGSKLAKGNVYEAVRPRANYSRCAIIEALTNLLAHRSYSMVGIPACINIFDESIDLINPCRTNGANKRSIEYGAGTKENPRLHHILTSREYGLDSVSRGIPSIRRSQYAFSRREPRISLLPDEFSLELFGI